MSSPSFHDVLFPPEVSYGSSGGPKFKTTIFEADSGYEQRNITWSQVRSEYDAAYGIKTLDQIAEVSAFFMARRGRAYGFRYKDWGDYTWGVAGGGYPYARTTPYMGEIVCQGDGETVAMPMFKEYSSAQAESGEAYSYRRRIKKPVWGSFADVRVYDATHEGEVDGDGNPYRGFSVNLVDTQPANASEAKIDYANGTISLSDHIPADWKVLVGYGEFHVPVRFDTDHLDLVQEYWNTSSWPHIPLVEVRDL